MNALDYLLTASFAVSLFCNSAVRKYVHKLPNLQPSFLTIEQQNHRKRDRIYKEPHVKAQNSDNLLTQRNYHFLELVPMNVCELTVSDSELGELNKEQMSYDQDPGMEAGA